MNQQSVNHDEPILEIGSDVLSWTSLKALVESGRGLTWIMKGSHRLVPHTVLADLHRVAEDYFALARWNRTEMAPRRAFVIRWEQAVPPPPNSASPSSQIVRLR